MPEKVVTRFAPSPTGYLHVGALRTALFAYVYAKNQDGKFLLRIEDTDKSREVEGAIDHIKESLKWLGIESDDEPLQQSKRLEVYKEWAEKLIADGKAYIDPYSPEEVQKFREAAQVEKKPFLFRNHRPDDLDVPKDWYGKQPLRFKTEVKSTSWHDEVWGDLKAGEEAVDDFILIKSDGYPTYNFAHIIDDHETRVTHVMRGEEFLASVPKFLMLYEALDIQVPKLATMPPILAAGGIKKLSKRDGAKDVLEYRDEDGYLADAVFNYIASLGWNDGTDQEIYSPDEIIKKFSLDRIQKSGAQFDIKKLEWMNWEHLKQLAETNVNDLVNFLDSTTNMHLKDNDPKLISKILPLAFSKSRDLTDLDTQIGIFTDNPGFNVNKIQLDVIDKSLDPIKATSYIQRATQKLEELETFDIESVEKTLRSAMKEANEEPRVYLNLIRWSISGVPVSPNLFEMMSLLGQEESVNRLKASI